jgi:uncharacterized membrane protein
MLFYFLLMEVRCVSVAKRKQKNTDLERQKKLQREKEAKKKQMRQQLPAKQGKGGGPRS